MRLDSFLIVFIVVVIGVALINISVTFIKISDFKNEFTGYASGFVNLSVVTVMSINLTRNTINWSAGMIDPGKLNATLFTSGDNDGIVQRGNWSGVGVNGFIVENIGSVNASLFLQSTKNASDFFGGTGSQQAFQWNVSNKESGSCSGGTIAQWENVNKTLSGTRYCTQFNFGRNNNEVYIDILLTVPYDAANIGAQSDTITVTANAAG